MNFSLIVPREQPRKLAAYAAYLSNHENKAIGFEDKTNPIVEGLVACSKK